MASSRSSNKIGSWAFLIGIILAVILGVFNGGNATWTWLLLVIGIIVGLFNISQHETQPFLISGLVLILASAFGQNALSSADVFVNVLNALLVVFVPATIIVAVKNVFSYARN